MCSTGVVLLFYPTNWRKNMRYLLKEKELETNWFCFSRRIYDNEHQLYYAKISTTTQFYCEKTGRSLIIDVKKSGDSPRLVILSDPVTQNTLGISYEDTPGEDILEKWRDEMTVLGFDGIVYKSQCPHDYDNPLCMDFSFMFKDGILREMDMFPKRCGIIKYSKTNNSSLREKYEGFPTCAEIDDMLEKNKCAKVSEYLYKFIE